MKSIVQQRNLALDFAKGCCVVAMIVYHTLGYLPISYLDADYFRFVSASFIFMAGFVATHVSFVKYDQTTNRINEASRQVARGLKLIGICVVANILINCVLGYQLRGIRLGALEQIWNTMAGFDYRLISFDLLVPIGYLLVILGIVSLLDHHRLHVVLVFTTALCAYNIIQYFSLGTGYYARFLGIGLLGAALGFVDDDKINTICNHWFIIFSLFVLQWVLHVYLGLNYALDIANTILSVIVIYSLGRQLGPKVQLAKKLLLLGQYTLLSYLFQILFLRIIQPFVFGENEIVRAVIAFLATALTTIVFISVVNMVRKRFTTMDLLYKTIFS